MNHKKYAACGICLLSTLGCLIFTACTGPSKEQIAKAQDTYTQLVTLHNQVVEAHRQIDDNSLDENLAALTDKLTQINTYNLNEMNDKEIDILIETMSTIMGSYEEYLAAINQIKENEDSAVLVRIPISLINNTSLAFTGLYLYQQGNSASENLLESLSELAATQRMTGLTIYRNVENTPWIMELTSTEGVSYSLELPVAEYTSDGCILSLTYDAETGTLLCN